MAPKASYAHHILLHVDGGMVVFMFFVYISTLQCHALSLDHVFNPSFSVYAMIVYNIYILLWTVCSTYTKFVLYWL